MTAFRNPVVTESSIPIQVLYNMKIERIRILEYEKRSPPLPIHYNIAEAPSGQPSLKEVTIKSVSAPKDFVFEIDTADGKGPRIYETQLEQLTR